LPDAVLPSVDIQLAERFAQSPSARDASLIARYATGAVLDSVLATLDPRLGMWACDVQAPILAYVLRVNRVLARPRIERALASRESTGCYGELLMAIADVHYDPILEDLARSSLDDPAPRVRTSSIRLLGRSGSPAMEAVLSERYSKWIENWTGRELEVTPAFAERGTQQDAINEGANLLQALTTATSWVTGQDKLLKLLSITRVPRLRRYLEFELNAWRELTITVNTRPGSRASMVAWRNMSSSQCRRCKTSWNNFQPVRDSSSAYRGRTHKPCEPRRKLSARSFGPDG
jgi:hypothetical protein